MASFTAQSYGRQLVPRHSGSFQLLHSEFLSDYLAGPRYRHRAARGSQLTLGRR